jgi:HEPN domain-containing protein
VCKSPLEMSFEERKSVLIQSCFLETADMDYLTARWAYGNGIFHNFYWSAAQCVEKYLKAALLYNGGSVKKFGHNLNHLYAAVGKIDPGFYATIISMPRTTGMGRDAWHGKSMALFVDYLDRYGSPNARYSLIGTFINGPVVHTLDSLCALTRRFIRRSNFLSDDLFRSSEAESSIHERIGIDCDWMVSGKLLLERLFAGKYHVGQGEALRNTFQSMNFSFFDERTDDEATFGGEHFTLAPLLNHLIRLRKLDDREENIRIVDELRAWADANMKLPKEVRDALRGVPE